MPTQSSILSHSGTSSERLRSSEDVIVRIAPEKIVSFSVERSVANYTKLVGGVVLFTIGGPDLFLWVSAPRVVRQFGGFFRLDNGWDVTRDK